ncbi:MAG: divergent polysaccharide deacetylase family protein [Desulfovibrio sp.]|jgi:polysaccharide deacetylase 2 family uncharacterized protein YibQ|nr:divergent polysaccharide deacetylase family protein [Desulfovibrio sp.]
MVPPPSQAGPRKKKAARRLPAAGGIPRRGKSREKDSLFFPFLAAFLLGLLLAAAGVIGLSHILQKGRAPETASLAEPLPRDASPPGTPEPVLTEAAENAVAGALADLQDLPPPGDRPPPAGAQARMVIVIDDLGENMSAITALLALDYPVTFAFWPHGSHVREGAEAVHKAGGEILVHYPMEPLGYPRVFPGPRALLSSMPPERIASLVEAGISAVPHAAGLNNHMGSRFTQDRSGTAAVALVLKRHNLFLLDSLTHKNSVFADLGRRLGVTTFSRDVFLDDVPHRKAILAELRQAERIALRRGRSIAIGHPLPETLAALKEWQHSRNTAVRLVRLQDLR